MMAKGGIAFLFALGGFAITGSPSAGYAEGARIGLDVDSRVHGHPCSGSVVLSVSESGVAGPFFEAIASVTGQRSRLDALLVHSNQVVFSLDVDTRIAGGDYCDEDLVAYDATSGAFSLFFDASAAGVPAAADLDAASIEWGTDRLLLSFDTAVILPGDLWVRDADVVRYSGTGFEMGCPAQVLGVPIGADITALHHDAEGLYFSLDRSVSIGGEHGADHDVWCLESTSNVLRLARWDVSARADIQCFDRPQDSDGDWLTDFEELTGRDEAASTYPGTDKALSPASRTSNPLRYDTDGDGMGDGAEAACGTDPTRGVDVLRFVTEPSITGGLARLTWSSVPGKHYAIHGATLVQEGFTNRVSATCPAAEATNTTSYTDEVTDAATMLYRVQLVP